MIIFFIIAYLIGSIPFGLLLTKLAGYGDIRKIGSGNIGATNVLRTGNKKLAAITLFLDGVKGALAVLLAQYAYPDMTALIDSTNASPDDVIHGRYMAVYLAIGFTVVIGHNFPIWLKFKGGKGLATALGVFLTAVPYAGLIACAAWAIMAAIFRISSLAGITSMIVSPVAAYLIYGPAPGLIALLISALVIARHHANIRRLLKGEEPKIGKKKNADAIQA